MKSSLRYYTCVLLFAMTVAISGAAQVQTSDLDQLKTEVAELKAIVARQQALLEQINNQKSEAATVSAQGLKAEGKTFQAGWDNNRPILRSSKGDFEANLGGFVHFDARNYTSGSHPPNTFLIRRARLFLDGRVAQYYEYKVEGDFADTTSTLLRDGWIRVHRWDAFQVQAGQFKEPFSQEELRSDQAQDFVERSMANSLAPQRSPGIMVLGVVKKGIFEYQAGLFNGKGTLNLNTVGTPEGVVRVRFSPARRRGNSWVNGLSFGTAFAIGRSPAGSSSLRGQTESKSYSFFAPEKVSGSLYRANGEVTWIKGPFAIRSEFDHISQGRLGLGASGSNLAPLDVNAFAGQVTYLITGEKKPDNGAVVPKKSLFGDERGLGAWEVKFRYAFLDMNDHTSNSNRANSMYFGTNWYLNRFVKNIVEAGVETYRDPLRTPNPGDKKYFVVLDRVQFAF